MERSALSETVWFSSIDLYGKVLEMYVKLYAANYMLVPTEWQN